MNIVYLGIGSNIGNRERNLKEAVYGISKSIGNVVRASSVYETEPWGFKAEQEFLNMVVKVETELTPSGILGRILMIESLSGRVRTERQYSSRVLDLDILLYNDIVIDEASLQIPHPRMHERKFVLVPMCEIASEMIHPVLKKSSAALLKSCKDKSHVKKFEQ